MAAIDFEPDVLNLKSKGKWVTVYIELPEGYDVNHIDVSSIRLNGVVPAESHPREVGDYDKDGIPDLTVKFDRSAVQEILGLGSQAITITGDGSWFSFQGTDKIEVISP